MDRLMKQNLTGQTNLDWDLAGKQFLTIEEVANLLQVSNRTVYNLIYKGTLRACRITYHITLITKEDFFLMIKETTYCKRSVSLFAKRSRKTKKKMKEEKLNTENVSISRQEGKEMTGLAPKSMGEDGQFKYRRLPKDSYKQGIITDIRQMGGYPEYKGTPYVDTDGDVMPDEWEKANGLNPNDPSDANKDCTGDGYTNIEKYINGISTRNCIDWSDLRNNYDTLASKGKLM